MGTSKSAWKGWERRGMRALGGQRNRVTGQLDEPDGVLGMFAYQFKLGYNMPGYLRKWLMGIVSMAKDTDRVGVVVWKPKYAEDKDALVILRFEDWVSLHGEVRDDDQVERTPV